MQVKIEQLKKYYGSKLIVNIDSLTIEPGKILGLTGANGTGKTTLLRIVAGLDERFTGRITYNGHLGLTQSLRQQVTYLSQKPYMMQASVKENIAYPLKLRKVSEELIGEMTSKLMEELGLEKLAEQNALLLSGGEAQKVALARALIFNPKLLLLDEPTASIDAQTIKQIEKTLKRRNKEQHMTMVMISHDKNQLTAVCNSIIEMDGDTCTELAL